MMETYGSTDIIEIPLGSPRFRQKVERFLEANALRMDKMDLYYVIEDTDGSILAGGGISGNIIKCVAVSEGARSLGLAAPLISRLVAEGTSRGHNNLCVFTKPSNEAIFASLGFRTIASAPAAILMENGRGVEAYEAYLRSLRDNVTSGIIVIHANPLTLGHVYLFEEALKRCERLFVVPVGDDSSRFPYAERCAMIDCALAQFGGRAVRVDGSQYQISALTFPTYFLKDLSEASETQMRLDLDLFARHITQSLGATVRFVGTEPTDPLTARYNALMQEMLPSRGISIVEIPRLTGSDTAAPVTATSVRAALDRGDFRIAAAMTPSFTHPYLLADLATRALRLELDTPFKPGLVGPDGSGAHRDMDYAVMSRSIDTIRPFFGRIAALSFSNGSNESLAADIQTMGIEAERAMMASTGGVNTHRGAIFALGLAVAASARVLARGAQLSDNELSTTIKYIASSLKQATDTHGSAAARSFGIMGAREMALEGYILLFEDWLPFYRQSQDRQQTLLRIMSTLDDTCVIHRVGYERAQEVKRDSADLSKDFSDNNLKVMCTRYAAEGISPGGAADMLSLTLFLYSITN